MSRLRLLLEEGGWSRVWYGLATAVVIAGGGLIYQQVSGPPPSPPAGSANLWVDSSGGSCTRQSPAAAYVDAQACGSLGAAYNAAQSGDTVLVKAGSYAGTTLSGSKTLTIATATGETANITSQLVLQSLSNFTLRGDFVLYTGDPYRDLFFEACNSNVTVDGVTVHKFTMLEGNLDITLENSDIGNYGTPGDSVDSVIGTAGAYGPVRTCCGSTAPPATNILITHNTFHDVFWGVPSSQWAGAHPDCFEMNGYARHVTVSDNDFYHCQDSFIGWYTDQGELTNITVTGNNFHDGPADASESTSYFAVQALCDGTFTAGNWVFSNNTVNTNLNATYPGPAIRAGCPASSGYSNFEVTGNTFNYGPPSGDCAVSKGSPNFTNWHDNTFIYGNSCVS